MGKKPRSGARRRRSRSLRCLYSMLGKHLSTRSQHLLVELAAVRHETANLLTNKCPRPRDRGAKGRRAAILRDERQINSTAAATCVLRGQAIGLPSVTLLT